MGLYVGRRAPVGITRANECSDLLLTGSSCAGSVSARRGAYIRPTADQYGWKGRIPYGHGTRRKNIAGL